MSKRKAKRAKAATEPPTRKRGNAGTSATAMFILFAQPMSLGSIRASMGTLLGASKRIAIGTMLTQARAWDQSSDAVWAALAPNVRAAFSKSQAARSPVQQRLSNGSTKARLTPHCAPQRAASKCSSDHRPEFEAQQL